MCSARLENKLSWDLSEGVKGGRINLERREISKRKVRSVGGYERGCVSVRGCINNNPKKPPEITGSPGPKDYFELMDRGANSLIMCAWRVLSILMPC